ncbi:PH domain-containing protein [Sutcliffiella rhizosphaerae]|uniref:YdbS-like PH domain-containing protein n=1 Tax=Sutcliffiella rhizosphaerae TaxID=2880967 RepID=A0ABM8YTR4_9BACI|nr:PH domain-containing protein [Sutcliffiella rhizosphaerae]CAG9623368.1 hypothetical protein BACCIP111883_04169 [Sutcliffiella rhizosphaerae]
MRPEPKQKIDKKALSVWRISAALNAIFYILLAGGYFYIQRTFQIPSWTLGIVVAIVIIVFIFTVFVFPVMQWKRWRYEIHEHEIDLQSGIFIKKRTLIPMVRVQHVDTRQGPILKRYHLSTVLISTAATIHVIPALDEEQADQVRDYISKLARVTEDDV